VIILLLPYLVVALVVAAVISIVQEVLEAVVSLFGGDPVPDPPGSRPRPRPKARWRKRPDWTIRNGRRFTVVGPSGTIARQVGEAINGSGPDIWFAWSPTRAALLGNGQIRWEGAGPYYPSVDLIASRLRWPDGSTARFGNFGSAETMRIQENRGFP
jgi:hypothetical protein